MSSNRGLCARSGAAMVFALGQRYGIWPPVILAIIGLLSFAAAWPWKQSKV